jgi:hypothetical protein
VKAAERISLWLDLVLHNLSLTFTADYKSKNKTALGDGNSTLLRNVA